MQGGYLDDHQLFSFIVALAEQAGLAIMAVYTQPEMGTTYKQDDSPLTRADITAHEVLVKGLKTLTSSLPVLSEESSPVPYEVRQNWKAYWLVDPLDGTKEFIKRIGEFTVNIALVEDGLPILGVVHAPASNVTYYASKGKGAFKKANGRTAGIRTAHGPVPDLKIAVTRSHGSKALDRFLQKTGAAECIRVGSSLKFCLVAEGTAHLYPRFGPTMEWDTAAGQCIVEEAGGSVTDLHGKTLGYNKPDLINPWFMAYCDPAVAWKPYISPDVPATGEGRS